MQTDGLIVCDILPSLSDSRKKFGVKAPSNDGIQNPVIVGVRVIYFGDLEEVPSR